MTFIIIFLIILIIFALSLISSKLYFLNKQPSKLNKNNLYSWMNLTKKERYIISKNESNNYFNKRKLLLEEIRSEYKKLSKRKK